MSDRLSPLPTKKEDPDQPVSPGRSGSSLRGGPSSKDLHGPMTVKHYISDAETKGLVDFINTILPDVNISTDNDELFDRVKDGILLCRLLFAIAPHLFKGLKQFKTSFANENRAQFEKIENYKIFLQAAGRFGCNIVNLDATDLLQGTPHLVLGILWQIVKSGLLKKVAELSHSSKLPPEEILLSWFNYHLRMAQWPRVVTNFTSDLSDSHNLTILMNQLAPEHCDKSPLEIENNLKRAEAMLSNAEKIQCRKFVSAEDVVKGDAHLIGFVATIFTKFPFEMLSAPAKSDIILNVINKIDVSKLSNTPLEADFTSKETAEQYAMLFDSDDDGYITFEDIKNTLDQQGIFIADSVLEQMYQDSNKKTTEKLNYEEFVPFLIKFAALNKKKDLETQAAQQVEFSKRTEELENKVKALEEEKLNLEIQLQSVSGNLSACNSGTEELKAELAKQQEITNNLQSELEKLRAYEVSNQKTQKEFENNQNEIQSLNEQKNALEKENNEYKDRLGVQTEKCNLLASNLDQLKQMLQQTKTSLVEQEKIDNELNEELEALKNENKNLQENINNIKNEFEDKLKQRENELNDKNTKIHEYEDSLKQLEEKLTQRQNEINELQTRIRSDSEGKENDRDRLIHEKNAMISELESLMNKKSEELDRSKSDQQNSVEILMQKENNIIENTNTIRVLEESLKEKEKELLQSNSNQIELNSKFQKELIQKNSELAQKIELINSQQESITKLEAKLNQKESELLNKEISFSELEKELRAKLSQSKSEDVRDNSDVNRLRNEIHELRETLLNKENVNEQLQTQIKTLQMAAINDSSVAMTSIQTSDEKDKEISALKAELLDRENQIQQLNVFINALNNNVHAGNNQIVFRSDEMQKIFNFVKRTRKWFYFGLFCAVGGYVLSRTLVRPLIKATNDINWYFGAFTKAKPYIGMLENIDELKQQTRIRYNLKDILGLSDVDRMPIISVTTKSGTEVLHVQNKQ